MTMQESFEEARIPPVFKRKMKFMSMLVFFFSAVLSQLHGVMSSQDAAKLTVNFGKLIRHSLGAGPEKKVKLENAQHPHTALVPNA